MKYATLNNGVKIPFLGLGTYKIGANDAEVYRAVRSALDTGYRHIDTAAMYGNEIPVGKAIRESGIAREEIFVTTKLWGTDVVNNNVPGAFEKSLHNLNIGYIDLYLVHWPVKGKLVFAWREMEKIYHRSGDVKAIGVSNYLQCHLKDVLKEASVVPSVNQMELHPYLIQREEVDYCLDNGIRPEAWSPIGSNKILLLKEPVLADIAGKYGKTPAQIVLRWDIDRGVVSIPKSSDSRRQAENFNIFDFTLSEEDIRAINALDKGYRTGMHPDKIEF